MVKLIAAFAPAKLNLFLRVVGRRADGYHELDSLFVPITIGDRISLQVRPSAAPLVTLGGSYGNLPADDRNLAVRAARSFVAEFGISAEILVDLHKATPIGAGLGGGSSDAGTVLRILAALFRVDAPDRLARIAVKLGADVPYFLDPRPARVGGIGDRIAPLDALPPMPLVVAVPPIEVSTAEVFHNLVPDDWSGPASEAHVRALVAGEVASHLLVNDLARPAMARWPAIARVKAMLEELGARAAAMTGSGAAVFGIFATGEAAARAADEMQRRDPTIRAVTTTMYSARDA